MRLFAWLGLGLLGLSAPASAEWLTQAERDRLWRDLDTQLRAHARLVYHAQPHELPDHPGFVMTNERAFWTMQPPAAGRGGLQLGFATLVNFNLLAARRSAGMVVADGSPETIGAMMSYWKPLFLAAESPAEWVAFVAGFEPKAGDTVESVFARIRDGEKPTLAGLQALEGRLEALRKAGTISDVDKRFALAVAHDQIPNPSPGEGATKRVPTFRSAVGGTGIAQSLYQMYGVKPATDAEARSRRALSFLEKPGFDHVRSTLEKGRDHYAVADIRDGALWRAVGDLAKREKQPVSDIYFSTLPAAMRIAGVLGGGDFPYAAVAHDLPTDSVVTYEAGLEAPHAFQTTQQKRAQSGVGEFATQWVAGEPPVATVAPGLFAECSTFLARFRSGKQ